MQFNQVDYLAVAYTDEGVELRQAGIRLPIMVMNPSPVDLDLLIQQNLEPEVYDIKGLETYLDAASRHASPPPIHLKLETGMHRLGFSETDLVAALAVITHHPSARVASVFSHLAASEDPRHDTFTQGQFQLFDHLHKLVSEQLGYTPLRHMLNSSGIVRFRDHRYDMVRLGIGLYGIDTSNSVAPNLLPISTLRTVVSQVKNVKPGDSIGYERAFIAPRDMTIATIGIGYADGYKRALGNGRAEVVIRDRRFPTVGNICMDMTMVDVTAMPSVQSGDEVEVFGAAIPVQELAERAGTNAYEIISTVSARVKRVYLEE
jgi:alanine racemase